MIENEMINNLFVIVNKLHERNQKALSVGAFYFEPGEMEYLEESDGYYDEESKIVILKFESKGTRYQGRTFIIERMNVGDEIVVKRDPTNIYNSNNFILLDKHGYDVGSMPAEICNALAPLYDNNMVEIINAKASFVEHITDRSRHAKQAMLFVELRIMII